MTQTKTTTVPYNTAGTINIHVNNPSANVGGMPPYAMPMMPYPVYYPVCYPPNYYLNNMHPNGINQVTNINTAGLNTPTTITKQNQAGVDNPNAAATATAQATTKTDTNNKKKEREIVVLTDNYIKNLENYLRNNNVELRKTAVKELLTRFKEDKSRYEHPSLTALLNIALQDPNASIRAVAMSIIGAGYAKGDASTEKLLGNIQQTKNSYRQDAVQAAESLLEMSKTKTKVEDNSHYPQQQPKKKGEA